MKPELFDYIATQGADFDIPAARFLLRKMHGKSALDVGSGNGNSAIFLLRRFNHVTAYESDERMFAFLMDRVRSYGDITPVMKEVWSLDPLLADTEPQLVKIDIEGGELELLRRSPMALRSVPAFYVEVHGSAIGKGIKGELRRSGYGYSVIGPDQEHYWILAEESFWRWLLHSTELWIRSLLSRTMSFRGGRLGVGIRIEGENK